MKEKISDALLIGWIVGVCVGVAGTLVVMGLVEFFTA